MQPKSLTGIVVVANIQQLCAAQEDYNVYKTELDIRWLQKRMEFFLKCHWSLCPILLGNIVLLGYISTDKVIVILSKLNDAKYMRSLEVPRIRGPRKMQRHIVSYELDGACANCKTRSGFGN